MNAKILIDNISFLYDFKQKDNQYCLKLNDDVDLIIDTKFDKFNIKNLKYGRSTIFDLTKNENHSVVMLIIKLIQKGYALETITLEKSWQTGHDPIYLDVFLQNPIDNSILMIEVKEIQEFYQYTNPENDRKVKQLLSYAMQETNTILSSFYAYDFENNEHKFGNIYCKELREQSLNSDDFYDRWNKVFDDNDFIETNSVFNIKKTIKTYDLLRKITERDTKFLYSQFLTILRLNSISDKPTAFMKMINLFLAKLADEITENKNFSIKDQLGNRHALKGMKFQYIENETPESFMKRLNELYKIGMQSYLNKFIIDYSDEDLVQYLNKENEAGIFKIFDDLRLKRNVNFSFIEIYDEQTFLENFTVVKEIVKLLENFKFKYETRHQFLGDFFEELLNTSLKQEAGQFFTPYPVVDFILLSLDFDKFINNKIEKDETDFIPSIIDYACGAGHFLISAMSTIQSIISEYDIKKTRNTTQKINLETYQKVPFSWATKNKVVGIEKDYRLAKTTKIATFLNGDGNAEIISGDGINKFNSTEYLNTILYTANNRREVFDYVISNPPYSVDGFMLNFRRNGIDKNSNTFSLLTDDINAKDSAIEVYFVERMEQLLKRKGIGAIVLPQSILSGNKYVKMRNFLLKNFKILSMLLTADLTFSGTTTSPVTLFLRKEIMENLDYEILIIKSPKYANPNTSKLKEKETKFLGYEFSSNRSRAGIKILSNSELINIASINKAFIETSKCKIPAKMEENCNLVNLSNILINSRVGYCGDIYPKKLITGGYPISTYCKINEWSTIDFDLFNFPNEFPTEYLEISNLIDQIPTKRKNSTRFCKKGDILISSLTPRKTQIVIAKKSFMVSSAIHVLSSFVNDDIRDKVHNELKSESTIAQMNALLDGFKITYAKISEQNLYNNILINI